MLPLSYLLGSLPCSSEQRVVPLRRDLCGGASRRGLQCCEAGPAAPQSLSASSSHPHTPHTVTPGYNNNSFTAAPPGSAGGWIVQRKLSAATLSRLGERFSHTAQEPGWGNAGGSDGGSSGWLMNGEGPFLPPPSCGAIPLPLMPDKLQSPGSYPAGTFSTHCC